MDTAKLQLLTEQGYLYARRHKTLPITIYKYTPQCVVDQYWTPETLLCRGIVIDDNGVVVGRPFKKFFNFEEHYGPLPDGPYEVWVKYDGSLITAFFYDGDWRIVSSGSFYSKQTEQAEILWKEYESLRELPLDREYTYQFEVIYPENRIVVNYGEKRELRLLSLIHTEHGYEQPPDARYGFPVAECLGVFGVQDNPLYLKDLQTPNEEGFVLRYLGSGLRLKIKFDEYLRLHRLMTNVTIKDIWKLCMEGRPINRMLEDVPNEFYQWFMGVVANFWKQWADIDREVTAHFFALAEYTSDRKAFSAKAKKTEYHDLLMKLLDGQQERYSNEIWKRLKPKGDTNTFTEENQ